MNDKERLQSLRQDFLKKSEEYWPEKQADMEWEKFEKVIPPTGPQRVFSRVLIAGLREEWIGDNVIQSDLDRVESTIEECDDIGKMSTIIDKLQELLQMSRTQ